MHKGYDDILSKIAEPPTWHDQNGTPRYGEFRSDACPSIYSSHVALVRIACQHCGREFDVELHTAIFDSRMDRPPKRWHYGDPPAHGCTGDTMNCVDLSVLQYWSRDQFQGWQRLAEFEGGIDEGAE